MKPYSSTRLGTPAERICPPRGQIVTRARLPIARPVKRMPMISKMIICQTLMFTMRLMTKEPAMTEMPDMIRTTLPPVEWYMMLM